MIVYDYSKLYGLFVYFDFCDEVNLIHILPSRGHIRQFLLSKPNYRYILPQNLEPIVQNMIKPLLDLTNNSWRGLNKKDLRQVNLLINFLTNCEKSQIT